jgi:hypothetical protein
MSSYYSGQGGDVGTFRDTVLAGRPATGRRQFVPPKPQVALVIGSETLAAEPSPQRKLSYKPVAGPGGKDHLAREGGSIVANHDIPESNVSDELFPWKSSERAWA